MNKKKAKDRYEELYDDGKGRVRGEGMRQRKEEKETVKK